MVLAAGLAIGTAFMSGCRKNPYIQGERIYIALCSNCHMDDGSGLAKLIPPLTPERLTLDQPQRIICLIKNGLPRNPLTNQQMPAHPEMSVTEMTNLINYLGHVHEGRRQAITLDKVIRLEAACQTR